MPPAHAMEASHAESKKGPRAPKHTYSLADYGLTAEQVKERFKGLLSRVDPASSGRAVFASARCDSTRSMEPDRATRDVAVDSRHVG